MTDTAPMTVYECKPECGFSMVDRVAVDQRLRCPDCNRWVEPVPVVPVADARRAVLAELTSDELIGKVASRVAREGTFSYAVEAVNETRRVLSALAAHLAEGESA